MGYSSRTQLTCENIDIELVKLKEDNPITLYKTNALHIGMLLLG